MGGVGGGGFIRLAAATTYCIGRKSSFPPNLSFKQIIQVVVVGVLVVVMHQRYCGSPERRRLGEGPARGEGIDG